MGDNTELKQIKTSQVARYIYVVTGFLLVSLGILGAFLPLLPTTIFLLLASACFMKSSPRANNWLKNNRWLGAYLRNYQDKTGLTIASKIAHIAILWIGIMVSAFFFTENTAIRVLLFVIAVSVTVHLVMIKTARK
jgi:uncharacterized membrane protein YbaN (DUF454 family)